MDFFKCLRIEMNVTKRKNITPNNIKVSLVSLLHFYPHPLKILNFYN